MTRQSRKSLEEELISELRAWQNDQDVFDEVAAEYLGLNRTDVRCLDITDQHGSITAGELARAARLTTGAVTAVIDRLEGAGLMRRVRDESDRRRVLVEVTEKNARLAAPVWGPMAAEADTYLKRYTADELRLLLDFIRRGRAFNQAQTDRVAALPPREADG